MSIKLTPFPRILILLAFLAPASLAQAAKTKEFCESLLAPHIQTLIENNRISQFADQSDREEIPRGLPVGANLETANAALLATTSEEIRWDSDLGATTWKRWQLEDWISLSSLHDPERGYGDSNWEVYHNVHAVIGDPSCNLRGLSVESCEALRASYSLYRKAYRQAYSGPRDLVLGYPPNGGSPREFLFDEIYARLIATHPVFNFPWMFDREKGHIYFESHILSGSVLPILMRERLIRHLDIMGPNDRMMSGDDLPLETRLAAATLPFLVPILPIILQYPMTLQDDFYFGGRHQKNWVSLYRIPIPTMFKELKFQLEMTYTGEASSFNWVTVSDDETFKSLDEQKKRILGREIKTWLATLAKEFNSRFKDSSRKIEVVQSQQAPRFRVKGIAGPDQVLFYAYALERSKN